MDINDYCSFSKSLEDPRVKSSRYCKGSRVKFDKDDFDFANTQFLIDNNYIGDPPHVQVSIDNLNDNIDENFLKKDLTKFGRIRTLEIIRHPRTSQHLGLAKVQFEDVSVARACIESFNGKHLMGRQLRVFLDVRFTIIEKLKAEKLNPRPQQPPTSRQRLEDRIATLMRQPNCVLSTMVGPQSAAAQATQAFNSLNDTYDYPTNSFYHAQPYLQAPTRELDKLRVDYELSDHQRRSPISNNHSNHHTHYPTHHNSHIHSNSKSQHHSHSSSHHDRSTNDLYDQNSKLDSWSDHNSEDNWKKSPEPIHIELTLKQIDDEVLPHCFGEFFKELTKNLESTIFKKLRESYGYQCLEKAQTAYKQKQDQIQLKRDQEKIQNELQKQFETRFILSKSRSNVNDRQNEAPRPRVNLLRQRTSALNSMHEDRRRGEADLRRVNRSSAYVNDPGRRGSHSTSIESDFSDGGSSSSSSSRSSSPSSTLSSSISSRSSSPFGSSSCSSYSRSSSSSRSGSYSPRSDVSGKRSPPRKHKSRKSAMIVDSGSNSGPVSRSSSKAVDFTDKSKLDERTEDENLAISALIDMGVNKATDQPSESKYSKSSMNDFIVDDDDDEDEIKPRSGRKGAKATGKRKKKTSEIMGVASEYRSAKRFAADPSLRLNEENSENAMMLDENFEEGKPDSRFIFPERSSEVKRQMLDDLYNTMTEEDIMYLKEVHSTLLVNVPFGSEHANRAHFNWSKRMIEAKPERHPKWWKGCSRCDVIEISEKEKMQIEENYEDLTKAPIKSNVIQAATSSRRDARGDQRRIAVLNPELDADILRLLSTNTLQVKYSLIQLYDLILGRLLTFDNYRIFINNSDAC